MAKEHGLVIEAVKNGIMNAHNDGVTSVLEIDTFGGAVKITIEWVPETEGEEHG